MADIANKSIDSLEFFKYFNSRFQSNFKKFRINLLKKLLFSFKFLMNLFHRVMRSEIELKIDEEQNNDFIKTSFIVFS